MLNDKAMTPEKSSIPIMPTNLSLKFLNKTYAAYSQNKLTKDKIIIEDLEIRDVLGENKPMNSLIKETVAIANK